jgi:signal transduction histidine kinase
LPQGRWQPVDIGTQRLIPDFFSSSPFPDLMNISGILLAGMVGLFALAMGYVVIFVLYQRRIISRDLEKQKLETELETDYQRKLLHAMIDSQEAERKRIAHDLHDEIGTLLSTSRLYFNQLSPGRAEEQLTLVSGKLNLLFDEMMGNIRRISHDLRPVILENLGLTEAIENIRHKLMEGGLAFDFTYTCTISLTREAELILYRIIQELINNTLKHAQASCISLRMEEEGDQLNITYSDNGIGFTRVEALTGLGLRSIESRLSLMETSLQIMKPEQGAQFLIRIPVHQIMKR